VHVSVLLLRYVLTTAMFAIADMMVSMIALLFSCITIPRGLIYSILALPAM
jgi:hypothetical protein